MRFNTLFIPALLIVATGLSMACSKDEKKPAKDEVVKAETKDKPEKKAATKKVSREERELKKLAEQIETEEDFQEEAEKEITVDNLEAEADKMEQELAAVEE